MRFYEDVEEQLIGTSLDLGSTTLSAEQIVAFARAYDPQPFHVDAERARATRWGGLIASGWQVCGTYMRLLYEGFLVDVAATGSPGADEVRWHAPVRPGDVLSGRITFESARRSASRPEMGLVFTRNELHNQRGERVLSYRGISMVRCREPRAAAAGAAVGA